MRSLGLKRAIFAWNARAIGTVLTCTLCACTTEENPPPDLSHAPTPVSPSINPTHIPTTAVVAEENKKEIAGVRSELLSLNERTRSLERNLEVLLRGKRSGLYEDTQGNSIDFPKETVSPMTKAEEMPAGREREIRSSSEAPPSGALPSAQETVADAELKMQRAQYGEAVVILTEIQKSSPDLDDGGHSKILLAECWNHLKQNENAIQVLRSFYLMHPKSSYFLRAKIVEAQSFENMGSRERALSLYKEVVSLGPKTGHAQTARSAMQRLRDER